MAILCHGAVMFLLIASFKWKYLLKLYCEASRRAISVYDRQQILPQWRDTFEAIRIPSTRCFFFPFCFEWSTSKFDERFVSHALLTASSFASLQRTWRSSLTRWSSVTLKSQPTGFITTLIIAALARSVSSLSHLWKGRAQQGFSWIKTQAEQRRVNSTSLWLAWFPTVTLL